MNFLLYGDTRTTTHSCTVDSSPHSHADSYRSNMRRHTHRSRAPYNWWQHFSHIHTSQRNSDCLSMCLRLSLSYTKHMQMPLHTIFVCAIHVHMAKQSHSAFSVAHDIFQHELYEKEKKKKVSQSKKNNFFNVCWFSHTKSCSLHIAVGRRSSVWHSQ